MRVSLRQLKKIGVETVSGVKLGRVCDAVFETDGQSILQYEVRGCCWFGQRFLVNRSQVVRFEEEKMVVDDTVMGVEGVVDKKTGVTIGAGAGIIADVISD